MVTERTAFVAEALGTLILALVVFAVTDAQNHGGPGGRLAPVFIGLTISALISVIAPLTQAGFNPARDFVPVLRLLGRLGPHRPSRGHTHRVFHGLYCGARGGPSVEPRSLRFLRASWLEGRCRETNNIDS